MNPIDPTRRAIVKAAGASAALGLVAGCLDDGDGDDDVATDGDDGAGDDDDDPQTADDPADGPGDGVDGFRIYPDDPIRLEGWMGAWLGLDPAEIEGVQNPTLVLEDGEEYEIGWIQGDGTRHNLELWDEDEAVVDDYATDLTDDPGDGDFLTFTASDEIASYRCEPHAAMQGEIRVDGAGSDDGPAQDVVEPGTTILVEGLTGAWEGREPAEIAGKENPTLVFEDGEKYEIGWVQGDGSSHNIELRDENDAVVDDYGTQVTDDPDDDQFVAFEATAALAYYVCRLHGQTMRGKIRVE